MPSVERKAFSITEKTEESAISCKNAYRILQKVPLTDRTASWVGLCDPADRYRTHTLVSHPIHATPVGDTR